MYLTVIEDTLVSKTMCLTKFNGKLLMMLSVEGN